MNVENMDDAPTDNRPNIAGMMHIYLFRAGGYMYCQTTGTVRDCDCTVQAISQPAQPFGWHSLLFMLAAAWQQIRDWLTADCWQAVALRLSGSSLLEMKPCWKMKKIRRMNKLVKKSKFTDALTVLSFNIDTNKSKQTAK